MHTNIYNIQIKQTTHIILEVKGCQQYFVITKGVYITHHGCAVSKRNNVYYILSLWLWKKKNLIILRIMNV